MIRFSLILLLFPFISFSQTNIRAEKNCGCDSSNYYLSHVYNKERLKILDKCITVYGYVKDIRNEKDGDLHMLLEVDGKYEYLLKDKNYEKQDGCLVIEPIYVKKVTQLNAIGSKKNYINKFVVPKKGDYIRVCGVYVLDKKHGGHSEIHPVTSLTIINKK